MNLDLTDIPLDAWDLLKSQLTPTRREKMELVASKRTNHIRLVLQDVHDPHNISACLRSAEAFGIFSIDIVEEKPKYKKGSTAARGVENWLSIHKHTSIAACAQSLKAQGYLLAKGVPRPEAYSIQELPVDRPIAVIFGNEHDGVSPEWDPFIDLTFTIPMVGFVESLNISVSAAITLQELCHRGLNSVASDDFYLDEQLRKKVLSHWVCIKNPNWQLIYERLKQE